MDIKRKKKEKRIRLLGGLIGICVAVVFSSVVAVPVADSSSAFLAGTSRMIGR